MGRSRRLALAPSVEPMESRALLTWLGAFPPHHGLLSRSGFVPSPVSIAVPQNQGPQGINLALNPTGVLSPRQLRREQFVAVYKGPYTIGPGRTSTEAAQTFIRGAGSSNTMLHSDIQLQIITPKDPALPISGVSAIFDRNINSNTSLGFDVSAPQSSVDAAGRPNHFSQVSLDPNISAGTYVEGYSQGTIDIHYQPSGKQAPGLLSQGTAIVVIRAQIYAPNVAFILRNSNINH